MAIGDDAKDVGYPIVPDTGENGRVRWGAREINYTRDLIAQIKKVLPTTKAKYREASGIHSGTSFPAPSLGANGDVYFRLVE